MPDSPLTREALYALVWSEPTSQLAPKLGLSDVGLAKVCKRHEIPRPERGYWAKLRAGKTVRQAALKPVSSDMLVQTGQRLHAADKLSTGRSGDDDPRIAFERDPANAVIVDRHVDKWHPLVARTLKSMQSAKADERGLVRPHAKRGLDVRVTKLQIDRVARILDALIRALESREIPVRIDTQSNGTTTSVTVDGEKLCFLIAERVRRYEHILSAAEQKRVDRQYWQRWRLPRFDYEATGVLTLSINNVDGCNAFQKSWSDTPRTKLESRLNSIIVGLYKAAQNNRLERDRREQQQREFEEQRRIAELRRKMEALEQARVEDLDQRLVQWRRCNELRAFISKVEESWRADQLPQAPAHQIEAWLNWAYAYVDSIDPIRNSAHPFQLEPPNPRTWGPPPWQ